MSPDSSPQEDSVNQRKLKRVWNQKKIPVVLRRTGRGQRLRVRLPYAETNKAWLRGDHSNPPEWNAKEKCWELPKTWFNDFVNRALDRFGMVYIIQPFREQEICAPACKNANGHECECSCMGQYHGVENDGTWFEVSDAFATRWGKLELACRLLKRSS